VGVLLHQLAAARRQSLELRDQLLRAKHHTPIVIGSPLGTPFTSVVAWLVCAVLAVACTALYVHSHRSKVQAAARCKRLQQALKINDALWRQQLSIEQAKTQQLEAQLQQQKQKEAAWRHSVEQTALDLNQRAAALQARSPITPGHALMVSFCADQAYVVLLLVIWTFLQTSLRVLPAKCIQSFYTQYRPKCNCSLTQCHSCTSYHHNQLNL
jgi:hypothetical protein